MFAAITNLLNAIGHALLLLGQFLAILFLGLLPGNVSGGFSLKGVLNPFFLALWLPIALYLVCAGLEKRGTS